VALEILDLLLLEPVAICQEEHDVLSVAGLEVDGLDGRKERAEEDLL